MDVDLALFNAREAASKLLAGSPLMEDDADKAARLEEWAGALADAFSALDGWMSKGGFAPDAWRETESHL